MDEWIDIVDSDGKPTGTVALKSEAHKNGWYHNTVHVWCYHSEKKVLLQKRGRHKLTYPGLWDVSVAGHIAAGESVEKGALRELEEEIGLQVPLDALTKVGIRKGERVHPNGILDNEFYHVFLVELTTPLERLQIQEEEVDAIDLFDLQILKDASQHGNFMVPNFHNYYDFVFEAIIKQLQES